MSNLDNSFEFNSKDEEEYSNTIKNVGIAASQTETINRFGSAAKEHLAAYEGIDRETGQVLKKGLKSISESMINSSNRDSNIRQQAGFAAEVKTVARENAERTISGDTTRSIRTDDLPKQFTSTGRSIGGTNDQLYDIAYVDESGIYIDETARQLKYVGRDAEDCCRKLLDSKYDKYRDADVPIEIKKDFYNDVQNELSDKIESLNSQIQKLECQGKRGEAEGLRNQLDRAKKTKANLRKGALTDKEAIEARLYPELSTAKDIARLSHRAGVEGLKWGAILGGGMSAIQNIVSVIKGDEDAEEAAANVIVDTGAGAASGYVISCMGTSLKGVMQNSYSELIKTVSAGSLPTVIATGVVETAKTLYRFADGQIDQGECFCELGEKGTGIAGSTVGMTIGQAAIPIPVVGAVVGGIIGYSLSASYFRTLKKWLTDPSASEQRRIAEAEYEIVKAEMERYRAEIERISEVYFADRVRVFNSALNTIRDSLIDGNTDGVIRGSNMITEKLGGTVQYRNMEEFEAIFDDDNAYLEL